MECNTLYMINCISLIVINSNDPTIGSHVSVKLGKSLHPAVVSLETEAGITFSQSQKTLVSLNCIKCAKFSGH